MSSTDYDFSHISSLFAIEKRNYQNKFNMRYGHYHDAYEIYYLLSGERTYFIKDRTFHLNKGDLIFIKKDEIHKTINRGANSHERILINFKRGFLGDCLKEDYSAELFHKLDLESGIVNLNQQSEQRAVSLLMWLLAEDRKDMEYSGIAASSMMLQLLVMIAQQGIKKDLPLQYESAVSEKIFEIARYMNDHYQDALSLDILSKKFYISKSYLSRSFKVETGINITNYLNNVRIKEAQIMLRETDLSISRIYESVGFENLTHFERVFKSIVGQSASGYRKTIRNEGEIKVN